jgi:hypothetical protein
MRIRYGHSLDTVGSLSAATGASEMAAAAPTQMD